MSSQITLYLVELRMVTVPRYGMHFARARAGLTFILHVICFFETLNCKILSIMCRCCPHVDAGIISSFSIAIAIETVINSYNCLLNSELEMQTKVTKIIRSVHLRLIGKFSVSSRDSSSSDEDESYETEETFLQMEMFAKINKKTACFMSFQAQGSVHLNWYNK